MSRTGVLDGVRIVVAGAGLAGLSAAHDLEAHGASVVIIDARDRVGGRVWTIRGDFAFGQHAEAGADLIESEQTGVLDLAERLGLKTSRILTRGFGYYGPARDGRPRMQSQSATFRRFKELLNPLIDLYRLGDERWDNAMASRWGATSVAAWLREVRGDRWIVERFRALRGLFLADPENLSLLALVDFFAGSPSGPEAMMRISDGNDRLATGLAGRLKARPTLNAVLRRVRQNERGIIATVEVNGTQVEREAEFLVCTLPPANAREILWEPPLPEVQHRALTTLPMGPATRLLLQFGRRFWRRERRPAAFGSPYAFGAVWDGNEQHRGRAGILSLLAGGGASNEFQALLTRAGVAGVVSELTWLGSPAPVLASRTITWERDPWAQGGYAYFPTTFRPSDRQVLALPAARVFFAGEHTSIRWQGYMNGAIDSGRRAAAEIAAGRRSPLSAKAGANMG